MASHYEKEIIDLHQYFEDWFTGKLEQSEANAARVDTVLAEDFHIITSDGRITPRSILSPTLYAAHGRQTDFRIWIENVMLRQQIEDMAIVTYEEWQTVNSTTTKRTSTVIFRAEKNAPNGLIWLHVHESGLQVVADGD